MKNFEKILMGVAISVMLSSFVIMVIVFITAYSNGVNGLGYEVMVDINFYNEAFFELLFILISIPFVLVGTHYLINLIRTR